MKKVGFIGWRGMVGSVLLERMRAEKDFAGMEAVFFTTSQAGESGPDVGAGSAPLQDAFDLDALAQMEILVTCQGGDYTRDVHPRLRAHGWEGAWVDAASALRMEPGSVIVLDPVNRAVIDRAVDHGIRDFIGGNCTVSLMLMGLQGLFEQDWVEWLTAMTYQSASGAGARNMKELVAQMAAVAGAGGELASDPASAVLELDRRVGQVLRDASFPVQQFGAPLAASLIPWIDKALPDGRTREEWKGGAETNRILGREHAPIPVDGQCVRVGAMRCHSQALTVKLKRDIPLDEIEAVLAQANAWSRVVANEKEATLRELTPAAVSGTLDVPVGRLRKMTLGNEYLTCFTVGDQLLWGAAEPVRRMLAILLGRL
jgi:aspartate-semialdehyde dehydrogenase